MTCPWPCTDGERLASGHTPQCRPRVDGRRGVLSVPRGGIRQAFRSYLIDEQARMIQVQAGEATNASGWVAAPPKEASQPFPGRKLKPGTALPRGVRAGRPNVARHWAGPHVS